MKAINRVLLRKLLGMLGSHHDGEVLNAARRIDDMVRKAHVGWDILIPVSDQDHEIAGPSAEKSDDIKRLDELLKSQNVADVLKIRLRDMRLALSAGKLSPADRRLLRILHRKAVIDGAIVER